MTLVHQGSAEGSARRGIVRRATLYTVAFIIAAIVAGVGGSALIAWLVSISGLPFLQTWIALSVLTLGVPMVGLTVREIRDRYRSQGEGTAGG